MNKSKKMPLRDRASNSAKLARVAWRIIKSDKKLIAISTLSYVSSLFIFTGIIIIVALLIFIAPVGANQTNAGTINIAKLLFIIISMFVIYFVINFFNGAISYAALQRFDGEKITIKEALVAASKKSTAILLFSGLQTTVGAILQAFEERVPMAGKIAVWLTGAAWNIANMFSIPVIMTSNQKNPLKIVKKSATTFKSVWRESVFIGLGLGIISLLFGLVFLLMIAAIGYFSVTLDSINVGIAGVMFVILFTSAYALIMSTLKTILMTAAYYYATTNKLPAGFDEELIRSMFRPKKKWLA